MSWREPVRQHDQKSDASDRFLGDPTNRWGEHEGLKWVGLTRSTHDRRTAGFGAKLPIPAAEMSERSWQRCPPSWRGTDPLSGL